jgi:hypothetical protein
MSENCEFDLETFVGKLFNDNFLRLSGRRRSNMQLTKQIKRKRIVFAVLAAILLIVTGVIGLIGFKPKETKKDIMMAYMEKKYGEKFTFVSIGTQLWDKKYTEMNITSDNLPRKNIRVLLYDKKDESGNRIFMDDYIFHLRQQEINDYLSKLAEPIYGPNKMFSMVVLLPGDAAPEMPIEDLIKRIKHQGDYSLYVCKDVGTKDEDAEQFRATLEANGTAISTGIVYVEDISIVNASTIKSHIQGFVLSGWFVMDRNYQFYDGKVNWR